MKNHLQRTASLNAFKSERLSQCYTLERAGSQGEMTNTMNSWLDTLSFKLEVCTYVIRTYVHVICSAGVHRKLLGAPRSAIENPHYIMRKVSPLHHAESLLGNSE